VSKDGLRRRDEHVARYTADSPGLRAAGMAAIAQFK
jgi:hypothetical protein